MTAPEPTRLETATGVLNLVGQVLALAGAAYGVLIIVSHGQPRTWLAVRREAAHRHLDRTLARVNFYGRRFERDRTEVVAHAERVVKRA